MFHHPPYVEGTVGQTLWRFKPFHPHESRHCLMYWFGFWVTPFLTPDACSSSTSLATAYRLGPQFGPLWFTTRPWSPHRRRRWGFGSISRDRSAVNDRPPPHLMLHLLWQFLSLPDRQVASHTCSHYLQVPVRTSQSCNLIDR
jgi:hypothetical protein